MLFRERYVKTTESELRRDALATIMKVCPLLETRTARTKLKRTKENESFRITE